MGLLIKDGYHLSTNILGVLLSNIYLLLCKKNTCIKIIIVIINSPQAINKYVKYTEKKIENGNPTKLHSLTV